MTSTRSPADPTQIVTPRQYRAERYVGLSLGGGKSDRTAVVALDYFPRQEKIFVHRILDRVKSEFPISYDERLVELLHHELGTIQSLAIDAPISWPVCVRCALPCPGYEKCQVGEIRWFWEQYEKREKHKRPNKIFTPYTQRPAEYYIANELEEPFFPSDALGANSAPLGARAYFLLRRLRIPMLEYFPKLSLWRVGQALNIQKSYLRFHRHAMGSAEARNHILGVLTDKKILFVYEHDRKLLVENPFAFDALFGALTAHLAARGQVERPPLNFPTGEAWISYPVIAPKWFAKRDVQKKRETNSGS